MKCDIFDAFIKRVDAENLKSHFATSSAGRGGCCCRNNLLMTSIRKNNVSMFCHFMDTFSGRVHAADMEEQVESIVILSQDSLACVCMARRQEDICYGG